MFVNYSRTNDKTCGMEMKSQNTMNTSIPSPSSDGILLIPTWVSVSVLVVSVLLLIGNCTGCSLLLKFLLKSSKLERTPSHTFILYATLVSMLASFIGIPISIVAASLRYQPARLATASRYLQSRFLFLFVAVMLHQLTCLTTERYLTITLKSRKITNHTAKNVAAICTAYVTATWLIIVIDDICDVTQTATIVSCSFVDRISPAYRSSSKVTVAIISIWLTACNLTLGMTTASTLMYINNIMKDSKRRLGVSACRFEKRRLTIIYALNVIYGIIWIPYGVIVARRNKMDRRLAEILRVYFEISCYASFLTLPFVSYTTDKRFRAYIMSFSRKNATVNHKAVIDSPNREGEPRSQNLVPRM